MEYVLGTVFIYLRAAESFSGTSCCKNYRECDDDFLTVKRWHLVRSPRSCPTVGVSSGWLRNLSTLDFFNSCKQIDEKMKKIVFALVLGLLVLDYCHAKFDENILGAQGAELLKDLKESGVLENFEEELEKMLHDKVLKKDDKKVVNEDKVADNKKEAEGVKVDQGMADFIQSYVEEKDIVLDQRILDHLASLPITERAKHMVHLTQVLDVIFEIALLDKPELDVKVLEVIKRVQSLPVMKTSFNKLIRPQEQDRKSSTKSSSSYSHPVSTNDVDLGVVSMIKDFILKLKAKPDFVFELILPTMVEYGLVSKDATTLLKMYVFIGNNLVLKIGFFLFAVN